MVCNIKYYDYVTVSVIFLSVHIPFTDASGKPAKVVLHVISVRLPFRSAKFERTPAFVHTELSALNVCLCFLAHGGGGGARAEQVAVIS